MNYMWQAMEENINICTEAPFLKLEGSNFKGPAEESTVMSLHHRKGSNATPHRGHLQKYPICFLITKLDELSKLVPSSKILILLYYDVHQNTSRQLLSLLLLGCLSTAHIFKTSFLLSNNK